MGYGGGRADVEEAGGKVTDFSAGNFRLRARNAGVERAGARRLLREFKESWRAGDWKNCPAHHLWNDRDSSVQLPRDFASLERQIESVPTGCGCGRICFSRRSELIKAATRGLDLP